MDSIAAPVIDIQFPTITVCQDEAKPYDNWGPLELFLNNLAFECKESEKGPYGQLPICNDTIKIRNDFKFLIELISKRMNRMMLDENLQDLSLLQDDYDLMDKIAVALTEGDLDEKSLSNLPNQNFAVKNGDIKYILKALINETDDIDWSFFGYFYYNYDAETVNCSSIQCEQNLKTVWSVAQTLSDVTNSYGILFGSLLAEFIPEFFDEFNRKSYTYTKIRDSDMCNKMDTEQKSIHGFFSSLSKYFGFEQNETISIYDIPAILNTPTNLEYGEFRMPQSFIFTLCDGNHSLQNVQGCYSNWKHYSENPEGK